MDKCLRKRKQQGGNYLARWLHIHDACPSQHGKPTVGHPPQQRWQPELGGIRLRHSKLFTAVIGRFANGGGMLHFCNAQSHNAPFAICDYAYGKSHRYRGPQRNNRRTKRRRCLKHSRLYERRGKCHKTFCLAGGEEGKDIGRNLFRSHRLGNFLIVHEYGQRVGKTGILCAGKPSGTAAFHQYAVA